MRHAVILGLTSLLFALLTGMAYQFDLARQHAAHEQRYTEVNANIRSLESLYVTQARALIGALNPQDPLLEALDNAASTLAATTSLTERDTHFQTLVTQVRTKLLTTPTEQMSEPMRQEWRRSTDQMNGALHRRQRLLAQLSGQRQ